jgi:hypothetical protein
MAKKLLATAAGDVLADRARSRDRAEAPITYGDFAEVLGLEPFRGPDWNNHPMSWILGQLNDEDHAAGRPFRSVLVINSQSRISGPNFFGAVARLRFDGVPVPDEQWRQFWSDEFARLLRHYHNPSA